MTAASIWFLTMVSLVVAFMLIALTLTTLAGISDFITEVLHARRNRNP